MKKIILLIACTFTLATMLQAQAESDIVITEIMYNLPGDDSLEYVEIYNKNSTIGVNLTGWSFTRGITHTFAGVFMSPGQYIILASDEDAFEGVFGVPAMEWEAGGLSNGGESLVLTNFQGMIADTVDYNDGGSWPSEPIDPDGGGASLVLCDPNSDNNDPANWISGDVPTGIFIDGKELFAHPGATCSGLDLIPPIPLAATAISANEIVVEYNEAVNMTAEIGANYAGVTVLSGDRDASNQFATLTLDSPLQDGVLTTVMVSNVQDLAGNQMSRTEEFDVIWHSGGEIRDIVITEIMYNAPGNDSLDFIELYNNSGIARNLWGCYFSRGIDFTFPNVTMQPGEYIVLAEDSANFELTYNITPFKWSGSLDNNSEKIIFNYVDGDTIDLVDYNDNNGWDPLADGKGYSLVLCDPNSDNNDTLSWIIATTFTNITIGDTLDMYANPGMADAGCPVDIQGVEELTGVQVYPNPNTGIFRIESEENTTLECRITDMLGRPVFYQNFNDNSLQINIKNVPIGIYLLKIRDTRTGKQTVRKILRQ